MKRMQPVAALGIALSGLGVAWALTPMSGPPLYDGLILGNDPYRYVSPPPGHRPTAPPTSGSAQVAVQRGILAPFTVGTKERPPQAQVSGSTRAFRVAGGTPTASVTVVPVQPDVAPPAGDVYDGNVYRISVSAAGKELSELPGATVLAALRGTGAKGQPVFGLQTASGWVLKKPVATGTQGVYAVQIPATGRIALLLPKAAATGGGGGGFPVGPVVAVLVFILLLGAVLVVVRVRHGTSGASR
jgi:hypothetical protein